MLNWLAKNWIWVALAGGAFLYMKGRASTSTTATPTLPAGARAPTAAEHTAIVAYFSKYDELPKGPYQVYVTSGADGESGVVACNSATCVGGVSAPLTDIMTYVS